MKLAFGMGSTALSFCLVLLLIIPAPVSAQSFWIDKQFDRGVSLEAVKPFDDSWGLSALTSVTYLSGRFGLTKGILFTAELPFAYYDSDREIPGFRNGLSLGNPYMGTEIGFRTIPLLLEAGVRLPLSGDNFGALLTSTIADHDRVEAFAPDVTSIALIPSYTLRGPLGVDAHFRLGAVMMILPNEEANPDRTNTFLVFGTQLWYRKGRVRIGAGFTGRMDTADMEMRGDERFRYHLGLAAIGDLGVVRPGLYLKRSEDAIDGHGYFVIGLSLGVPIR